MNTPGSLKCASAVIALVMVSACGSGSMVAPSTSTLNETYVGRMLFVNGRPVTATRLSPLPRYAELVPDKSKSEKYEYVFNDYGSYAAFFNYPENTKMIGQVNGLGGQGCTNALYGYGKKIFWNPGRLSTGGIQEYRIPKTLIKSLPINYMNTSSCAMNTSGDLAVGILCTDSCGPAGQVVIFKNATGTGKVYSTPLAREYFDGYDANGNLFADGFGPSYNFMLVELPKGSSKAVTISIPNSVQFPGSVQWDGTYLTVWDQLANAMYQYSISGTKATLKNTVQLTGSSDCAQTWIVKGLLYCGDAGNGDGEVFKYPAGGAAIAVLGTGLPTPLGVTAAKK